MYLKLSGMIESQLRDAYAHRHEQSGLTQADLAKKLEVDKSAIHNRLHGKSNMTLETIANMIWALGHDVRVDIFDPTIKTETNFFVPEEEENFDPGGQSNDARIEFEPVSMP